MSAVHHSRPVHLCPIALLFAGLLLPQGLAAGVEFHAPVVIPLTGEMTAASEQVVPAIDFAAFEPLADIAGIQSAMEALELQGERWSPARAELASDLGTALQAEGRHDEALRAFDDSLQVLRRLEGLHSNAQVRVLQARIDSHLALGQREDADSLQEALYLMRLRLHANDAVVLADAHLEWADWNARVWFETKAEPMPGGMTDAALAALDARLGAAFASYHKSRTALASASAPDQAERSVEIERRIAAVMSLANQQYRHNMPNALTKHSLDSGLQSRQANHPVLLRYGSTALQRAIDHSTAGAPPEQVAERLLELADWYQLMHRPEEASVRYAEAAGLLQGSGLGEDHQQSILQPGLPVHDPVNELRALSRLHAPDAADGWIDVAFDVDNSGKASNPRILAASSADAGAEQALLRHINSDAFRPGFADGQLQSLQHVSLRYHFTRQ